MRELSDGKSRQSQISTVSALIHHPSLIPDFPIHLCSSSHPSATFTGPSTSNSATAPCTEGTRWWTLTSLFGRKPTAKKTNDVREGSSSMKDPKLVSGILSATWSTDGAAKNKKASGVHTPGSRTSSRQTPRDSTKPTALTTVANMCGGLVQHFSEVPAQFGLTKQLVLRITLPHISLLLISIGYALAGCWILTAINYKTDRLEAEKLIGESKIRYKDRLMEWVAHHRRFHTNDRLRPIERESSSSFGKFAAELFDIYSRFPHSPAVLNHAPSNKLNIQPDESRPTQYARGPLTNISWNLFFIVTTLTSIGYGTNAPDSLVGRLFCVLYVAIGIPLFLICIADMAKFCTEFINRGYTEYLKIKHRLKTRWKRWRRREKQSTALEDSTSCDVDEVIIAGGEEEVAEFLWTHLESTQFVEIPFFLVYAILLGYMGVTSSVVAQMEGWSLQSGFYFMIMSVLTIGFGDVMPLNDDKILVVLALIIAGLVVMTTCVDIIGGHYIDKLHFFGRRLDVEDPLLWLKAVQQKRIDAMKREAMRKLFETIAALNRMHLDPKIDQRVPLIEENVKIVEPPDPPRQLMAFNATAESVRLRWQPPIFVDEGRRFWYTISYKTRTPQRRNPVIAIDFVNTCTFEVKNLKSFTLYEFSVCVTTRFGTSKPIRTHEYTEPCSVPQFVRVEAVSSETGTIAWNAPRKNNGTENYTVMFAQEPAPQFQFWTRFRAGKSKRFTLTGLNADTRYVCCVLAEHNFGLAAMSKSVRFQTRMWAFDEDDDRLDAAEDEAAKLPMQTTSTVKGSRSGRRPTSLSADIKSKFEVLTSRRSSQLNGNLDESNDFWNIKRSPSPIAMWRPTAMPQVPDPSDRLLALAPPRQTRAVISAARASQSQFHDSPMRLKPFDLLTPAGSSLTRSSATSPGAQSGEGEESEVPCQHSSGRPNDSRFLD